MSATEVPPKNFKWPSQRDFHARRVFPLRVHSVPMPRRACGISIFPGSTCFSFMSGKITWARERAGSVAVDDRKKFEGELIARRHWVSIAGSRPT